MQSSTIFAVVFLGLVEAVTFYFDVNVLAEKSKELLVFLFVFRGGVTWRADGEATTNIYRQVSAQGPGDTPCAEACAETLRLRVAVLPPRCVFSPLLAIA